MSSEHKPNVVFVFADQMRAQAAGYAGDPNVRTPNLDRLASESLNFTTAVSGCPVCSPARASFLTGRYPHTHGIFVNDVYLNDAAVSIAQAVKSAGYDTAYVGKWHVDGHGRSNYIPPERRQGFEFWQALECTHNYFNSPYYPGNDETQRVWEGYDAIAQTRVARQYIRDHAGNDNPFLLVLSWGPPHAPYQDVPAEYRQLYHPDKLTLRPNVPEAVERAARRDLAGYYAHVTALDDLVGDLLDTLTETGIADKTIFVFWSDHGDMLGSQGERKKQRPWDESVLVPLLVRWPGNFPEGRQIPAPINTPDLMPTLLGMCGLEIPPTVEGSDYTPYLEGRAPAPADAALIACYHPFGQFTREQGGREYRGVRTGRHTYVRDLRGPWLLYDNEQDPYQLQNLLNNQEYAAVQTELDGSLNALLEKYNDKFLPGEAYLERWGYKADPSGTVPYTN